MEEKDITQINTKLDAIIISTSELTKLATMVEKHERILRGGNGESLGLIAIVRLIEKTVSEDHDLLFGREDKPGLKGVVQSLSNSVTGYNKFAWIVTAAVVGTLLTVLFTR